MDQDHPSKPALETALLAFFGLNDTPHDGANLSKVERLAAAIDSSNYLNSAMAGCHRYQNDMELLTAALREVSITGGLALEFGVYSGRTINHITALHAGPVFGFDSFEGLPETWRPDHEKGAFKRDTMPEVGPNVELVVGWFEDSLPGFLAAHPGPVAFLHIDCDLYSSTKTVFHYLRPRIVPGTVIVFDEYFNYVGWRNHEYKAFCEFMTETQLSYRYIGAVPSHQQAAVVVR